MKETVHRPTLIASIIWILIILVLYHIITTYIFTKKGVK